MSKRRIYCYVDETGQDSRGRVFIVAVVVVAQDRDALVAFCQQAEQIARKGVSKWGRTQHQKRLEYLRIVFADCRFRGALCYAIFRGAVDQDEATVNAVARALLREPMPSTATIYVDGLPPAKRNLYSRRLRSQGLSIEKVRGIQRDENDALIRLADAVAGFVRDIDEGASIECQDLFTAGQERGILVEV